MKAYVRPRPIRIAYLVQENEHWQALLDAIFAESFARWGGRFTLIVPCENDAIRPAYIPWLEAYDPDIIYSYVDLSDATLARLSQLGRRMSGFRVFCVEKASQYNER